MDFEKRVKENIVRNEKYLSGFKKWLVKKGLANKTIKKHLSNTELFINDYLNYYDIVKAEDGLGDVFSFLNGWFIENCLWSSRNSLKETTSSIKKFYEYMCENNFVDIDTFKKTFRFVKNNMDELLEKVDEFNNFDDYYDEYWKVR